jgi:DNA-binding response OmpR family regulator
MSKTKKILIVDDDQDLLDAIANLLEIHGYQVYVTTKGSEVIDMMVKNEVDAVVTDVCMDGLDGFHLVAEIKKQFSGMPVILMSGVNVDEARRLACSYGADGFIAKPFRIKELIDTINMFS